MKHHKKVWFHPTDGSFHLSFILKFKRLVSAHLKSYRLHLLTQSSYGPKLHFGKFWARSVGSQGRLRRFYVYLRGRFWRGSEGVRTPLDLVNTAFLVHPFMSFPLASSPHSSGVYRGWSPLCPGGGGCPATKLKNHRIHVQDPLGAM